MEKFDQLAGLIFGKLYSEFPVPLRIFPEQFLEKVIDKDDHEGSFNFIEYFDGTVKWLSKAGYIWISEDLSTDGLPEFDVVLSEKGLGALRKIPESLEGTASIGERLSGFAKSKTADAIGTLISLAITSSYSYAASIP